MSSEQGSDQKSIELEEEGEEEWFRGCVATLQTTQKEQEQ